MWEPLGLPPVCARTHACANVLPGNADPNRIKGEVNNVSLNAGARVGHLKILPVDGI